jgi:hypothetical protein
MEIGNVNSQRISLVSHVRNCVTKEDSAHKVKIYFKTYTHNQMFPTFCHREKRIIICASIIMMKRMLCLKSPKFAEYTESIFLLTLIFLYCCDNIKSPKLNYFRTFPSSQNPKPKCRPTEVVYRSNLINLASFPFLESKFLYQMHVVPHIFSFIFSESVHIILHLASFSF